MADNRVLNTINNIRYSLFSSIPVLLLSFVSRYVFLLYLSEELLGANSLFANILTVLSFADLGIGEAIVFSLYKPLANNDHAKINALLRLYKKFYLLISVIILILGLGVIPFLPVLTNYSTLPNLSLIYVLYLLSTVLSYLYADKQSFLMADQKKYVVTNVKNISLIIQHLVQIIVIIVTKNFILYLLIQVIMQILMNIMIKYYLRKNYHYLKDETTYTISSDDIKDIKKNVFAMIFHKIGSIIVDNTDNIIISMFLGLAIAGRYSNYTLFVTSLTSLLFYFSGAAYASVGNLCAVTDDVERKYSVYKRLDFFNYVLYGMTAVGMFAVLTSCVKILTVGNDTFGFLTLAVIVLNFYINGVRIPVNQFKNASGLFWNDRYKPVLESIVNLVVSLVLVQYFGLFGVLAGTIVTRLLVTCVFEQYVVYKYLFKRSFIKEYIIFILKGLFITGLGYILYSISNMLNVNLLLNVLICGMLAVISFSLIIYIFYHKSDEYAYFKNLVMGIIKKFKR